MLNLFELIIAFYTRCDLLRWTHVRNINGLAIIDADWALSGDKNWASLIEFH